MIKVGDVVSESRIYRCTRCKNVSAFSQGERASPCVECTAETVGWEPTRKTFLIVSHDVAKEYQKRRTLTDKMADGVNSFCGHMYFVYVHIVWFGWWIWHNVTVAESFDPFPFGFLTLIVSLEAILLATFILISQNRQSEITALRSQLDYQVNLESEKKVTELLANQKRMLELLEEKKRKQ